MKQIVKCYVQPQMGDGGLCLGACALAYNKINSINDQAAPSAKQIKSIFFLINS